ncbi:MAG: hypothetical protein KC503_39380 [Myxococcales bacterium]|nr:hypothetical protein [Myxococcales bacterium]
MLRTTLSSLSLLALVAGCASSTPPPAQPTNKKQPAKRADPPPKPAAPTKPDRASDAATGVKIGSLTVDENKVVRVRGRVSSFKGIRLVPPSMIFTVTDGSGTLTAVIYEKQKPELREGVEVELIGTYKNTKSPMHQGPGTPPKEDVLVVDRYLISP